MGKDLAKSCSQSAKDFPAMMRSFLSVGRGHMGEFDVRELGEAVLSHSTEGCGVRFGLFGIFGFDKDANFIFGARVANEDAACFPE